MVGANPPPEPVPDEGGVSNEQRLKKKKYKKRMEKQMPFCDWGGGGEE